MEANWGGLQEHYEKELKNVHLRTLLADEARNKDLVFEYDKLIFDITHEKVTSKNT